jgi:hypothetical protein
MDLMTVNDDANYIIQLNVDGKWQTLTEEYSASAATNVMSNAHILTKLNTRFLSKRSDNMVIGECIDKRIYDKTVNKEDDIMTIKDWKKNVIAGYFNNDDGNGYWVKDGLACRDEVFSSKPEDATHMVWYNK